LISVCFYARTSAALVLVATADDARFAGQTSTEMGINQVAALIVCGIACVCDLRTRRIPNLLTFGGAAIAIAYGIWVSGVGGMISSVGGWFAGVALFIPMFLLGGMGAGDVKLAACIGAWLGPMAAVFVALYSALAGGIMAVGVALFTGYFKQAVGNVWLLLAHWRVVGVRPLPELTLEGSRGPRLPFALPIAAGALAAIWFQ
jgi:prepilin peptidase CpaA